MKGASPFGVPVSSPDHVKTFRPAVRLGRGVTSRAATDASSGRTSYFFASAQKRSPISFNLAGFLSATFSYCVQSLVRSYSSQGKPAGSRRAGPNVSHGGGTPPLGAVPPPRQEAGVPQHSE